MSQAIAIRNNTLILGSLALLGFFKRHVTGNIGPFFGCTDCEIQQELDEYSYSHCDDCVGNYKVYDDATRNHLFAETYTRSQAEAIAASLPFKCHIFKPNICAHDEEERERERIAMEAYKATYAAMRSCFPFQFMDDDELPF